jgi:heptaprenyl diphosphate synthase
MNIKKQLKNDLALIENKLLSAIQNKDPYITKAAAHLIKAGGKRIRPQLTLLSYYYITSINNPHILDNSCFNTPTDVVNAATAIELEHLATLYHDDIMDKANTRRGVPAAHRVFGESVAIVVGDYLFACAFILASKLGSDIINEQCQTLYKLCEGQIHDVMSENNSINQNEMSIDNYIQIIHDKTAALVSCAMFSGGILAKGSVLQTNALKEFGKNYGIAFQLKDDLLDLNLEKKTGKPQGTDLKKHMATLPVLLIKTKKNKYKELINLIDSNLTNDDVTVMQVAKKIKESSAYKDSKNVIQKYIQKTKLALSALPDNKIKSELLHRADKLLKH